MRITRRVLLHLTAGALASLAIGGQPAAAATPITLVVPTPAGGMVDTLGRLLGRELGESLGVPVVVENKPGASTLIATHYVMRAAPDANTLLLNLTQLVQSPLVYREKAGYDAFKDFVPVSRIGSSYAVLVAAPGLPTNSLAEFIQRGKDMDVINYGTNGIGSGTHIYMETFRLQTDLPFNHIPYKGEAPLLLDLMSGRLDFGWISPKAALEHGLEKKVLPLAVTSRERLPSLPDVPTFAELGYPNLSAETWVGIFAPAGTPPAAVERLAKEFDKAVSHPDVRAQLETFGIDAGGGTAADFAKVMRRSHDDWSRLVQLTGITLE